MAWYTCHDCVYRDKERCCIDPPQIVAIDSSGRTIQRDPTVNDERIACKWHMTKEQRRESDTIRMA